MELFREQNNEQDKLEALVTNYKQQAREMTTKIKELEGKLTEAKQEVFGTEEKFRYKTLARRLKEERNSFKDLVEWRNAEKDDLDKEIKKTTEVISDLKQQSDDLQKNLDAKMKKVETTECSVYTWVWVSWARLAVVLSSLGEF